MRSAAGSGPRAATADEQRRRLQASAVPTRTAPLRESGFGGALRKRDRRGCFPVKAEELPPRRIAPGLATQCYKGGGHVPPVITLRPAFDVQAPGRKGHRAQPLTCTTR
jgi:hypothetical protein